VLIYYRDNGSGEDRDSLLEFTCEEVQGYGLPAEDPWFFPSIDPYAIVSDRYWGSTVPCNLVVDDDMVIRYKVDGYYPSSLNSIVQQLLSE
jgi:hypothetical protein